MQIIKKPTNCQFGFSLIEVMLSIVILGGGLLALATGLSQGMILVSTAHHHQIAKEKASEAMESVFTSRDARKILNWNQIQNIRNGGIFVDGPSLLREQGPDGLVNTQDDGAVGMTNRFR
jgi:prepilin-type N-terminal cleavage/methylation domain-containing protein